jgi:deoxyribodipyrimidine photolyase-related protein
MTTVWVMGDQLNRQLGALRAARPGQDVVLMIESEAKLASKPFHRQKLHLVLAAMRSFARELRSAGFEVDYRRAPSFAAGLAAHRQSHRPARVTATEPSSWDGRRLLEDLGVELVRSEQFLCHYRDFARWANGRQFLRMEDFYRWRRRQTGYLMEGGAPAGGRWNFDRDNRRRPPAGYPWRRPLTATLDETDREVLKELPATAVGAPPVGLWATTRRGALARLRHVVNHVLADFGPYQDAMLDRNWHLAHSLLSPYLNLGLLLPGEVCNAVDQAWRAGHVPIASAEGFLRQILGWREYVWGVYWLWMPGYRKSNYYRANTPLPVAFEGGPTRMRCVEVTISGVHDRAYAHHIQRLMVLGNLSLLAGVRPQALVSWMWSHFIDGAEWVMLPNVLGMALHADGGKMATKPYAASGAYVNRMSDYCRSCTYDPRRRTGEDACPFTTLYWDFLARHRQAITSNPRMAQAVRSLDRLEDLGEVRVQACRVLTGLAKGTI